MSLKDLERRVAEDLTCINYPPAEWVAPTSGIFDVAIIGAGMAGLAASFALIKLGITNFKIFESQEAGYEGPWITYARMKTLRSTKELTGPAYDFPSLTFQAWYKAQHSQNVWEEFGKIPNTLWMNYLKWFSKVLHLPIQNRTRLNLLSPESKQLKLTLENQGTKQIAYARKVILATGRDGFGGVKIPESVKKLPKSHYAHTIDRIPFEALSGKRIAIMGVGASGFDAAAVALEHGAHSVELFMRRKNLPNVNKFAHTVYSGFSAGYYFLPDSMKLKFMHAALDHGAPPPHEALDRIRGFKNFTLHPDIQINNLKIANNDIQIETDRFTKDYDFLILATGFQIDGSKQPELKEIFPHIRLWKDQEGIDPSLLKGYENFPYLGPHFEFLGKDETSSAFLKNIYCYNFAATLSHALLSSDIPGIGFGAERLARGIAQDFFVTDSDYYLKDLQEWNHEEFPLPAF